MKEIREALKLAGVKESVGIFLQDTKGKITCKLGQYKPILIKRRKVINRKTIKPTATKSLPDYFEDPLTAFEDPLTAFEDPLTAFEDPLTAFEDPLTAFEDPLTAIKTGKMSKLSFKLVFKSLKGAIRATKPVRVVLYYKK
jgi:hypothetical protein